MAIRCPRCERPYDEARFAFGRTITCSCGTRVGSWVPAAQRSEAEPRFAADAMLGRLARWLRLLGFDTFWEAHVPDERLVRLALDDARWILTRDRALPVEWRVPRIHVVAADTPRAQLREVVRAFDLAPRARPFARCSRCNTPVEALPAERAQPLVPEGVSARQARFSVCPGCGRIYWEGTHVERMRRVIESLLAEG